MASPTAARRGPAPRLTTRAEGAALASATITAVHHRTAKIERDLGSHIMLTDGRPLPAYVEEEAAAPAPAFAPHHLPGSPRAPAGTPSGLPRKGAAPPRKNDTTLRLDHDDGRPQPPVTRRVVRAVDDTPRSAAAVAADHRSSHFVVAGPDTPASVAATAFTRSSAGYGAGVGAAASPRSISASTAAGVPCLPTPLTAAHRTHLSSHFSLGHDTTTSPRRASATRGTIYDPVGGAGATADTVHSVLARSGMAHARKADLLSSHFTVS